MQQRRLRLGDILDDYCPRERRVTNHAVVAMIDEDVKQTRCTTCDAEHEYKHARVPAPRRRKPPAPGPAAPVDAPAAALGAVDEVDEVDETLDQPAPHPAEDLEVAAESVADADDPQPPAAEDEWPVHRRLIRATLPRPEGQVPERKPPDFTLRQSGGRFESETNGNRLRGGRGGRPAHGGYGSGQFRTNAQRPGQGFRHGQGQGQPSGNTPRSGNRQGQPGQRGGGRPGQGGPGGQRHGQGRGPKRGR